MISTYYGENINKSKQSIPSRDAEISSHEQKTADEIYKNAVDTLQIDI